MAFSQYNENRANKCANPGPRMRRPEFDVIPRKVISCCSIKIAGVLESSKEQSELSGRPTLRRCGLVDQLVQKVP